MVVSCLSFWSNFDCSRRSTAEHYCPTIPNVGSVQHGIMRTVEMALATSGRTDNGLSRMMGIVPCSLSPASPPRTKNIRHIIIVLCFGDFRLLNGNRSGRSDCGEGRRGGESTQGAYTFALRGVIQLPSPCSIFIVRCVLSPACTPPIKFCLWVCSR